MFGKLGHPSLLVALVLVYPTQLVHAQSVETGRTRVLASPGTSMKANASRSQATRIATPARRLCPSGRKPENVGAISSVRLQSRLEARGENPWSILGNLFVAR